MATLQNLTDRVYDILTIPEDHPTVPLDYVQDLCNEFEFMVVKGMKFPFLRSSYLFRTVEDTTISAAITTASTTITVPTGTITAPNSYGYIIIENDVIRYTGLTVGASIDTLTGVTGISVSHDSGADCRQLYAVPSDYSHQADLKINDYVYEFVINIMDPDSIFVGRRYEFVQTNDGEYLNIHNAPNDEIAYFSYYKDGGNMDTTTPTVSTSVIPENWATQTIPVAVAGAIKKYKHMEQRGEFLMKEAENTRAKMRQHYGSRNNSQKPKITFGKFGSRRNF